MTWHQRARDALELAERLREIGAISANWAMTDEAEIRRTCRKAADCIERQVKALEEARVRELVPLDAKALGTDA